jgi:hypothetical protein
MEGKKLNQIDLIRGEDKHTDSNKYATFMKTDTYPQLNDDGTVTQLNMATEVFPAICAELGTSNQKVIAKLLYHKLVTLKALEIEVKNLKAKSVKETAKQ